ncbi:MAG TPA: hypothetical protein VFV72_14785 [Candidatus Limnocylindrales bacterium]|nr:hypothetical protein [Candidatus Limnocylindrales bacterium]
MLTTKRPGRTVTVLVVALAATACGGAPAPSPAATADDSLPGLTTSVSDVTYADGATVIDAAAIGRSIKSIEPADDGAMALTFNAGTEPVKELRAGQTVLLEGIGPRKVTGVSTVGDTVVVETADAPLSDVIQGGTLAWTQHVGWADLPLDQLATGTEIAGLQLASVAADGRPDLPPAALMDRTAKKDMELKFTGDVKGYEVEFELSPKADRLEFELKAKRLNISFIAKGNISNFDHQARMVFDGGEGQLVESQAKGLKGEAEVTWAAFQTEDPTMDDDITAFELPLKLHLPFVVGPVPMTMTVKANMRLAPAFKTSGGSSGGSFKFAYNSDHGFSSSGGSVNPAAKLIALQADLGATPTVTAGMGPTGFAAGLEFPRLELSLGHPWFPDGVTTYYDLGLKKELDGILRPYVFLTLNQYTNGMYTPGTTLTADIPPCQRASIQISAIAGYKLSVLGMAEIQDNTILWEKTIDKFKDNKPCTLTGT